MSTQEPLLRSTSASGTSQWTAFKEELRAIVILCGPACIQLGFQQAAIVTNQVFAGSLGANALAAGAIGFTVCSRASFMRSTVQHWWTLSVLRLPSGAFMCSTCKNSRGA